jgi:hypothetical protein
MAIAYLVSPRKMVDLKGDRQIGIGNLEIIDYSIDSLIQTDNAWYLESSSSSSRVSYVDIMVDSGGMNLYCDL